MTTASSRRHLIDAVSFLFNLSAAFVAYFLSTWLASRIGARNVDAAFAGASLLTLVLLPQFVDLMAGIGRGRATVMVMGLHLAALFAFVSGFSAVFSLLAFMVYLATLFCALFGLDVVLEKYSSDRATGGIRGRHLTVLNLAWVFAPFFAGRIFVAGGFRSLALVSAVACGLATALLAARFWGRGTGLRLKQESLAQALQLLKRRPIRYALALAFLLQVFYAVMVVETPLVLEHLGFGAGSIGLMFTIMLIPFVLVQYPLGRAVDGRFQERDILVAGFFIAGLATLAIALLTGSSFAGSFALWTALLFISRIGAAAIEVMRDSYFFKHVDGRDLHVIALLWSTMPLAYLVAPLFSSAIVRLTGSPSTLFSLLGLLLLGFSWIVTRLPETKN